MGGGDLYAFDGGVENLKKSWHPSTLKNVEKVYLREKAAEDERKKMEQLQKELNEQRAVQELQRLHESTGKVKKRQERLDWMYSGPNSAAAVAEEREAYLLGKKRIDKLVEQGSTTDELSSAKSFSASELLLYGANANSSRDMESKVREDPLLAIKKREHASLQAVLKNPLRLKALKEGKDGKKDKKEKKSKKEKKEKKEKKKHRHDESDDGGERRKRKRGSGDDSDSEDSESDGDRKRERVDKDDGVRRVGERASVFDERRDRGRRDDDREYRSRNYDDDRRDSRREVRRDDGDRFVGRRDSRERNRSRSRSRSRERIERDRRPAVDEFGRERRVPDRGRDERDLGRDRDVDRNRRDRSREFDGKDDRKDDRSYNRQDSKSEDRREDRRDNRRNGTHHDDRRDNVRDRRNDEKDDRRNGSPDRAPTRRDTERDKPTEKHSTKPTESAPTTTTTNPLDDARARRLAEMMKSAKDMDEVRRKRIEESRKSELEEAKRETEIRMKELKEDGSGKGDSFLSDVHRQTEGMSASDIIRRNRAFMHRSDEGFMSR
ncbi:RNA-splicing factor [Blyttiomyces sp. JEL0837]|nr:RNA-splicing factor [Blyttiomyces sp. JEL0837]